MINYDVPDTPEAYTHRIGRTGRAQCTGKACTFLTSDGRPTLRAIERRIGQTIPEHVIEEFMKYDGPATPAGTPEAVNNDREKPSLDVGAVLKPNPEAKAQMVSRSHASKKWEQW